LYPNEYKVKCTLLKKQQNLISGWKNWKICEQKRKSCFEFKKLEQDEHFGDCESVGDGIRELKINYAKGYRIYFKEKDGKIIVLLIGGDKSTQQKDIEKAKEIWDKLKK